MVKTSCVRCGNIIAYGVEKGKRGYTGSTGQNGTGTITGPTGAIMGPTGPFPNMFEEIYLDDIYSISEDQINIHSEVNITNTEENSLITAGGIYSAKNINSDGFILARNYISLTGYYFDNNTLGERRWDLELGDSVTNSLDLSRRDNSEGDKGWIIKFTSGNTGVSFSNNINLPTIGGNPSLLGYYEVFMDNYVFCNTFANEFTTQTPIIIVKIGSTVLTQVGSFEFDPTSGITAFVHLPGSGPRLPSRFDPSSDTYTIISELGVRYFVRRTSNNVIIDIITGGDFVFTSSKGFSINYYL